MKVLILSSLMAVAITQGFVLGDSPIDKPRLDGKIVGGYKIDIKDAPHQISLQHRSGHICGGSIISPKWILTAAHCTNGGKAATFKVRVGSSEAAKGGEMIQVAKIVQHKQFNYSSVDYDYSLLELSQEINFDDTKQAIKLPEGDEGDTDGVVVKVSGWGNTQSSESRSWLREAEVPLVNSDLCSKKYEKYGGITPRMICAGYMEGGKDACQGDSGGPLFTNDGVLIGVVSWGYGCARPDFPGVYSRVSAARKWIKENSGV
ncbi:hypothetical protein ACFFRR_003820 [Megaselia abdita]